MTHGCLIFADVARIAARVEIDGGGRRPGDAGGWITCGRRRDQPCAQTDDCRRCGQECRAAGYGGGIRVVIRIPGGEELAGGPSTLTWELRGTPS
ncbi:MAG: hypothetical protein ACLTYN_03800 [Dysosmobacter welbionis]